jgi:two-component system OmpR family sensor kinase
VFRDALARRLSVRLRVTLTFTAVMALLLAGTGVFLYHRFAGELDHTLDQGLRSRVADLSALVQQSDSGLAEPDHSLLTGRGEALAEILTPAGRVLDAAPPLRRASMLTRAELAVARRRTLVVEHNRSPLEGEPIRLLARPVVADGRRLVVVLGTSVEDRDSSLASLRGLLLLGGAMTLALAALAGYGAIAGALRPMERMRRRAGDIQAARPGQRLPVGPTHDEVARLGQTLNAMLERLEEAFARERTFVSDASHELRMPLTVLKGELDLALGGASSADELRAAVSSAAEETDRLVQLSEDLLIIARADHGELPVRPEPLEARGLLEGARRRFARRAADRAAAVTVTVPDGLVVRADRLRLEQALGNLLDNALRHGGHAIELEAAPVSGGVALHVRDDGPGFPPEFLSGAFERFARGDTARARGGVGLGLAIVAAIAQAHGGATDAVNRPGGGADVSIVLPGEE